MRTVVETIRRVLTVRVSIIGAAFAASLALMTAFAASGAGTAEIAGLNVPRAGHTGTRLVNGGVLIAGGENDAGPVRRAEVFDPSSRSFSLAGSLESGRADHSATLLSDGRVFLIGGREGDRALASTELSDDAGGSFENGPALNRARYGHSATLLPDGRIVVVGGDSGGTIEVFEPGSGAFRLLDARLSVPREFHAAALLHDGRILVAGGVDLFDGAVLSSAEILDLATMTISPAASAMRTPRSRFTLNVLPDGKVQAIGGDAAISMEMFNPGGSYFTARARLLDGTGALSAALNTPGRSAVLGRSATRDLMSGTGERSLSARAGITILTPDALDRVAASVTRSPDAGFALAAGGLRAEGVLSTNSLVTGDSPATVTTDKTDYAPGDTVVITGTGWMPGETVSMLLHHDDGDPDLTLTAIADDVGNFVNSDFVVDTGDLGATFLLTATGLSSGFTAQTTFTDGGSFSYSPGSQTRNATAGGAAVSFNQDVTAPAKNGNFTASVQVAGTGTHPIPAAWVSTAPASLSFSTGTSSPGNTDLETWAVNFTVPSGTPAATYTANIKANASISGVGAGSGTSVSLIVAACPAIVINTQPASQTVCPGSSVTFSVVATGSSLTYQWRKNTFAIGGATSPSLTINPANPADNGSYDVVIQDSCGNSATSTAATLSASDTTKPVITITGANPATVECHTTYSDAGATATDDCAGSVAVSPSGTVDANTVGSYTVTYTASDPSGNTATATRTVNVVDTTAPTIALTGASSVAVECHTSYTDAGATAHDTCAGDFTAAASGSVNVNVPGVYTITYNATDPAGNAATPVSRTVTVKDTTAPTISLSGPSSVTVECHTSYMDAGATAHDTCAGDFAAAASGSVNVNVPGSYTITYNASDPSGNPAPSVTRTVNVVDTTPPLITLNGSATVTVICHTSYVDAGATALDSCAGAVGVVASGTVDVNTVGTYTITYNASDPSGNAATPVTRTVNVTNVAPIVDSVTGPPDPLPAGSTATVTANFTDPDPGQTHTCTFTWDDPSNPTSVVTVAAGATSCSASHTYASASVNTVSVDVSDGCADDSGTYQFVVIYDPNAGFVTGGGFINSPPGAYSADVSLAGKANFGFVSKYQKGAKVPTGSTEFQFQVASFNFHSDVYQWLVISGALAQYKGTGTVNGTGNFGFLLTATDGQISGGGGVDKFRIKIWDNDNGGAVVYDNSPGSSDDINSANPEAIAGGSIVIHKN